MREIASVRRFGVTGGRTFSDDALIALTLLRLPASAVLVHGAAPGADSRCARDWGLVGRVCDPHPADWDGPCRPECPPLHRKRSRFSGTYCPLAGHYRNQEMVDTGIELLVVFPGGSGTADMVARAKAAGIPRLIAKTGLIETE